MVSCGVEVMWHHEGRHAVPQALLKPLGQVLAQQGPHAAQGLLALRRGSLDVFVHGVGGDLHEVTKNQAFNNSSRL